MSSLFIPSPIHSSGDVLLPSAECMHMHIYIYTHTHIRIDMYMCVYVNKQIYNSIYKYKHIYI